MGFAIWKFTLGVTDEQTVHLPYGAAVLHVAVQRGVPCLWAIVDPEAEKEPRVFLTFGTGHPVPDSPGNYLGSYMLDGGGLVFHVFESTKRTA